MHKLREESAEAKHQLKRAQQALGAAQHTAAEQAGARGGGDAATPPSAHQQASAEAATPEAAAAAQVAGEAATQRLHEVQREHAAELSRLEAELQLVQRQNVELQQRLKQAGAAAPGTPAAPPDAQPVGSGFTVVGGVPLPPAGPRVSGAIAEQALQDAAAAAAAAAAADGTAVGRPASVVPALPGVPPELSVLLPAALYQPPSAAGGAGAAVAEEAAAGAEAALQLTSSIYLLLDALEQEKRQLVATVNAKQVGLVWWFGSVAGGPYYVFLGTRRGRQRHRWGVLAVP